MELLQDPRSSNEDVLGFTNQTAILLCGMGAKELLAEFKQRNISIEALADLSIEDLKLLGADEELANKMRKELVAISKRTSRSTLTAQKRFEQLSEALVNSNKQLSLIQAFLTYARLRMSKEQIDSFIEQNNNLHSSKALEIAVGATISEIQDVKSAVEDLKLLLQDDQTSSKATFYGILGAVGLITCIVLRKFI